MARPLYEIAEEIRKTWVDKNGQPNVNYAAKPYLEVLDVLTDITDKYFEDPATSIVNYFLSNASSYRGDDARRIKAELKAMLLGLDTWYTTMLGSR